MLERDCLRLSLALIGLALHSCASSPAEPLDPALPGTPPLVLGETQRPGDLLPLCVVSSDVEGRHPGRLEGRWVTCADGQTVLLASSVGTQQVTGRELFLARKESDLELTIRAMAKKSGVVIPAGEGCDFSGAGVRVGVSAAWGGRPNLKSAVVIATWPGGGAAYVWSGFRATPHELSGAPLLSLNPPITLEDFPLLPPGRLPIGEGANLFGFVVGVEGNLVVYREASALDVEAIVSIDVRVLRHGVLVYSDSLSCIDRDGEAFDDLRRECLVIIAGQCLLDPEGSLGFSLKFAGEDWYWDQELSGFGLSAFGLISRSLTKEIQAASKLGKHITLEITH